MDLDAVELLGYLASALIVLSLLMASLFKLRVVNLIGAIVFTAYGLLIDSLPVVLTNASIVVIDVFYLTRMFRARADEAYFEVIEVPGHTLDHIAYHCAAEGVLFCGDTLFAGGCGRLFEGTPEQMHRSLSRLAALPAATRVYCAHEYTLANLAFARQVEPGNEALGEREQQARQLREDDVPTVPSTIELELATNPFLRSEESTVIRAAEGHAGRTLEPGAGTLAEIRRWKDAS